MLEKAYWDGTKEALKSPRFHVQYKDDETFTVMDLVEELQFLLPHA